MGRIRRASVSLIVAVAAIASMTAAPAQAARRAVRPLGRAQIGSQPLRGFHDRVFTRGDLPAGLKARVARLAVHGNGGTYSTPSGDSVHVVTSPQYAFDPSVNQSYADFLASLVHGSELESVTLYVAPFAEMQEICSTGAWACYADGVIVTTGDGPPADGVTVADLVAHEYGHHVANHRLNDLGPAVDWGPEYWATYEQVCWREDQGTAFPGDEGDNYALNPGEAWAETYRLMNGSQEPWDSSSDSFFPDSAALDMARRDVTSPYDGGEYIDRHGRFTKHGSRWRHYTIPVENDGTVDLRLSGTGSLDADLYVYATPGSNKALASSKRYGRKEHLRHTFCGYRQLEVYVYKYRGAGAYKLRLTLPFFAH